MFTYYGHIRSFTVIGEYYNRIVDEAFWACPAEADWVQVADSLRNAWDEAIKVAHTNLGMTDKEFYEYLRALESDPATLAEFKLGFETSFNNAINGVVNVPCLTASSVVVG